MEFDALSQELRVTPPFIQPARRSSRDERNGRGCSSTPQRSRSGRRGRRKTWLSVLRRYSTPRALCSSSASISCGESLLGREVALVVGKGKESWRGSWSAMVRVGDHREVTGLLGAGSPAESAGIAARLVPAPFLLRGLRAVLVVTLLERLPVGSVAG